MPIRREAHLEVQQQVTTQPPRWYGVAWYDYGHGVAVCYPVPIHVFAAWIRTVWLRLARGPRALQSARDEELGRAFRTGFAAGERRGYVSGLEDATRALAGQPAGGKER